MIKFHIMFYEWFGLFSSDIGLPIITVVTFFLSSVFDLHLLFGLYIRKYKDIVFFFTSKKGLLCKRIILDGAV